MSLRTVKMTITNNTKKESLEISNAIPSQGEVVTTGFPIEVENNGGRGVVQFKAVSERQGCIGTVDYFTPNLKRSVVEVTNTMSERKVTIQLGNIGRVLELKDNDSETVTNQGFTWRFTSQANNRDYVINISVAD